MNSGSLYNIIVDRKYTCGQRRKMKIRRRRGGGEGGDYQTTVAAL